jgi:predicted transcriptional regulator
MEAAPHNAISHRLARLASKLKDKVYRDSFVAARCRRFLAHQIRARRGDMSQTEFGKLLDTTQSVVSRLEDPTYGKMTLNSLLDVAAKTDRALLVQFVDWKVMLKMVADESEESSAPARYDQLDIQSFVQAEAVKDAALGLQTAVEDCSPRFLSLIYPRFWKVDRLSTIHATCRAEREHLYGANLNRLFQLELLDNSIEQVGAPARIPGAEISSSTEAYVNKTMYIQRAAGLVQ